MNGVDIGCCWMAEVVLEEKSEPIWENGLPNIVMYRSKVHILMIENIRQRHLLLYFSDSKAAWSCWVAFSVASFPSSRFLSASYRTGS